MLVTEQLTLEQARKDCRAIHPHKTACRSVTTLRNGFCDQVPCQCLSPLAIKPEAWREVYWTKVSAMLGISRYAKRAQASTLANEPEHFQFSAAPVRLDS